MSSAIGNSSGPSKSTHGDLWVDVRDFGAKADGGVTDNSGPIQAAVDALIAKLKPLYNGVSTIGVVYIPSAAQAYCVTKPIWVDYHNIEIRGDGWGSQLMMLGSFKHNVLQIGLRRVEYANINGTTVPLQIDSSYHPDLYGKLDSSVTSGPGQKWGIRTNGNAYVQFQASPMCSGAASALGPNCWDYWSETSRLTLEFCIEPPDGQNFGTWVPLLGLGDPAIQPAPFTVSTQYDAQVVVVTFKTSDMDPLPNMGTRTFSFSLAGAARPYRIAIQFDLVNAVCTAFLNGTQVAVTNISNMTSGQPYPFRPNSGVCFLQNDYYPMMIGTSGGMGPSSGTTGVDLRLYGFRMSNTLRYQNNGAGRPQSRVDSPGSTINDRYAYFTNDASTIAYLTGTDNPATAGRMVSVFQGTASGNGGGTGSGLFMHAYNAGGMSNLAVRDLFIVAGGGHGQGVTVGNVLELVLHNVRSWNAFHAIGSFNVGANYNIYVSNCNLQGTDAAYYGFMQLISGRDIYCLSSGKATFRLVGCNGAWRNVFVAFPPGNAECIYKIHGYYYGGNHFIENLNVDFEGYTLSLAAFYCEASGLTPATSLTLKDIYLGTVGANTALVMLKDMYPQDPKFFHPCWLSVENLQAFTNTYSAAIDVDGPLWHGDVKGVALNGPQFKHRNRWGSTTRVCIRDTKFTAPPRQFLWYSGAHLLEVRSPADGQFKEWQCLATGTYGTPNPPKWVGVTPLQLTTNGLAGYVLNHAYITVSLN